MKTRLQVRFGETGPEKMGFTDDLSGEGFFIKTATVFPPKTLLQVELGLPDGMLRLEGMVRWVKRATLDQIRRGKKGGMGLQVIRFLAGEGSYRHFVQELRQRREGKPTTQSSAAAEK